MNTTGRSGRATLLVLPLVGVALAVLGVIAIDPVSRFTAGPPQDSLEVERTILRAGEIELRVRNAGPETVTVAQVQVGDEYWEHAIDDRTLDRFEATTLRIPFPWEEGMPLAITFLTSTGITIDHHVDAAIATPEAAGAALVDYAALGVAVGVVPVAVGMLWLPVMRRLPSRSVSFFLAVTVGLLAFLLVDALAAGIEIGSRTRSPFGRIELFGVGALTAAAGLAAITARFDAAGAGSSMSRARLALFVAVGIGLHNFGEGLAVGAAVSAGDLALGSGLVVGFAVHNTTEGLAIVAPMAEGRTRLRTLAVPALVAGVPTIAGSVTGGAVVAPAFTLLALGVAFGAIAEVVRAVARTLLARRDPAVAGAGFAVGVAVMYATGIFAA